jgi:methoxymalonate biosynthesis acyl carrier protein
MKQIINVLEIDEIRKTLREFLHSHLGIHHLQDSDDMFELGLMSSLLVIQLVAAVEDEFGILLKEADLNVSHFRSINSLTELIISKKTPPVVS